MKFLQLNRQHYIRHDAVQEVQVVGREDRCSVELVLTSQERVVYKYCKSFPEAESAVRDLVRMLTDSNGATVLYRSDDQLATEGR